VESFALAFMQLWIRVMHWWQGLNLQKKLGVRLMLVGLLLMVYSILGMAGVVPNPFPNLQNPF